MAATFCLFAPDFVAESIPRNVNAPPKSCCNCGEMSRAVLSILRVAKGPLRTREIADALVRQGGPDHDPAILDVMVRRVGCALRGHRAKGTVRSVEETGL